MSSRYSVPALVTPLSISGLEAIRLLAREGIRVLGYDENKHAIGYYSRYCLPVDDDLLVSNIGRAAVAFPTSDDAVWRLAQAEKRSKLSLKWVRPPDNLLESCIDKLSLSLWAQEYGIPVPRSWALEDIGCTIGSLTYPVVVKPRCQLGLKQERIRELLAGRKVILIRDADEMRTCVKDLGDDVNLWLVQEFLHFDRGNPPIYIAGYISRRGEGVAFSHRKLYTSPPEAGVGVYIESAVCEQEEERILNWLIQSGYRGIFGVEMLYHSEGGYRLVDFNPRFGIGDTIGLAFGVNLPVISYLDALGEQIAVQKHIPPKPVRWTAEFWYLSVGMRLLREHKIRLKDYMRLWLYRELWYGIWDLKDPLPFFYQVSKMILSILGGKRGGE
jgi:predicted ATP-grasp superfamily ATP-dependent carboligase